VIRRRVDDRSAARSIAKRALSGSSWGCGHTLTIVASERHIIVFGLAIPARAAWTMEFSVGLMLILLGVRLSPAR